MRQVSQVELPEERGTIYTKEPDCRRLPTDLEGTVPLMQEETEQVKRDEAHSNSDDASRPVTAGAGDASADPRDLVEVRIPGLAAYIGVARTAVDTVSEQLHFSSDARSAVKLAVGEACNNAVLYAHGDDSPHDRVCAAIEAPTVLVSCRVVRGALEIDVMNEGNGFHPQPGHATMPEPKAMSEHGRGLALIEMMMDSVQYLTHNGCTVVRMRKLRPDSAGDTGPGAENAGACAPAGDSARN